MPNNNSDEQPPHPKKSPPRPRLNLDDCKLQFQHTAFVFTSSRTQTQSPRSPAPPSRPRIHQQSRPAHPRPSLSPTQLAKHSHGALDARCIVGPNMRAAGFVPLTHSRHLSSSTPNSVGVPTPSDPPPFPPIMFVSPSRISFRDHQHDLALHSSTKSASSSSSLMYFLPPSRSSGSSSILSTSDHSISSNNSIHPSPFFLSSSSLPLPSSRPTFFHPSIHPPPPVHSGFSSRPHSSFQVDPDGDLLPPAISPPPLHDGYPFPIIPPRRLPSPDTSSSPDSSLSRSSYATACEGDSPPIASTSSVSCPNLHSVSFSRSSSRALPTTIIHLSDTRSNIPRTRSFTAPATAAGYRTPAHAVPKLPLPPSFRQPVITSSKRRNRTSTSDFSFTELCDNSPGAWITDSYCLSRSSPAPSDLDTPSSVPTCSRRPRRRPRANTEDGTRGRKGIEKRLGGERRRIDSHLQTLGVMPVKTGLLLPNHQLSHTPKERHHHQARTKCEGEPPIQSNECKHWSLSRPSYSSFSFPPNTRGVSQSFPHTLGERGFQDNLDVEGKVIAASEHNHDHDCKRECQRAALIPHHRDHDHRQARQNESGLSGKDPNTDPYPQYPSQRFDSFPPVDEKRLEKTTKA